MNTRDPLPEVKANNSVFQKVENIFLKYLWRWREEMNNHEKNHKENLMKKDKEVEELLQEINKT
jgi:hypothetical protein